MHPKPAEGGAGPTFEVIARTWSKRVTFCTPDDKIYQALRYIECDPDIDAPANDITLSIEAAGSGFRIVKDGQLLDEQPSRQELAAALHTMLTGLSLADFPSAPLVHAASLRREGQRVMIVGPKGGGKTTLTLRLIQEGYDIEGDENVFVTGEGVVARPRALRVKASTAAFYPPIAEALRLAAYHETEDNLRIYNIDPRKAGAGAWRIEMGPVDAIVLLRPNHNGHSSLRAISPLMLAREVIAESAFRETERGGAVGSIVKMISGARGFELSLGHHDGALVCLDSIFR